MVSKEESGRAAGIDCATQREPRRSAAAAPPDRPAQIDLDDVHQTEDLRRNPLDEDHVVERGLMACLPQSAAFLLEGGAERDAFRSLQREATGNLQSHRG